MRMLAGLISRWTILRRDRNDAEKVRVITVIADDRRMLNRHTVERACDRER